MELTITVLTREMIRLMLLRNPGRATGLFNAPAKRIWQLHVDMLFEEENLVLSLDEFSLRILTPAARNLVGCASNQQYLIIKAPAAPTDMDEMESTVQCFDHLEVRGTFGVLLGAKRLRFDVGTLKMPRY